ncbi:MAG: glycosyltransferase [Acidimicrobiales bacterium]
MTPPARVQAPSLRHLQRLSGPFGLYEHARFARPRRRCGYCTDDAGRALGLACRLPGDPYAEELASVTVAFLERAHLGAGQFRLRLGPDGRWTADAPSDDAAGRALWGLGVAAADAPWEEVRDRAAALFDAAAAFRSPWPRATAYATLGGAELLGVAPAHRGARRLVAEAAERLGAARAKASSRAGRSKPEAGAAPGAGRSKIEAGTAPRVAWRWPEGRLTYANARLADSALAAAVALGRPELAEQALDRLGWLVEEETIGSRFSFAPTGGRGPGGPKPGFDQQPIEAWATADACARAGAFTADPIWATRLERAILWFLGGNDTGVAMFDSSTGGGYDGLGAHGVNRNEGAESTMAFVATMLQAATAGMPPAASTARRPRRKGATGAGAGPQATLASAASR